MRLTYRLTPRKLVARLRVLLRGADLDTDDFVRAGALSQGGEVTGHLLETAQTDLRTYAIRHGYPEAEVTVVTAVTADRHRADVTVDLTPGPARLVGQRVFYVTGEGHKEAITREDPTDNASGKLFATVRGYTVTDGQRTDEPTLGLADRALERSLRASGYFTAAVSHDLVRTRGRVVLRVRVDAGPRVLVRFEGNDAYDASALESALDLSTEDDRSASHLTQKLHDFYASRGFLDAEVTSRTTDSRDDPLRLSLLPRHRARAREGPHAQLPVLAPRPRSPASRALPRAGEPSVARSTASSKTSSPAKTSSSLPIPLRSTPSSAAPRRRRSRRWSSTRTRPTSPAPTIRPPRTCRSSIARRVFSPPRSARCR